MNKKAATRYAHTKLALHLADLYLYEDRPGLRTLLQDVADPQDRVRLRDAVLDIIRTMARRGGLDEAWAYDEKQIRPPVIEIFDQNLWDRIHAACMRWNHANPLGKLYTPTAFALAAIVESPRIAFPPDLFRRLYYARTDEVGWIEILETAASQYLGSHNAPFVPAGLPKTARWQEISHAYCAISDAQIMLERCASQGLIECLEARQAKTALVQAAGKLEALGIYDVFLPDQDWCRRFEAATRLGLPLED